MDTKEDLTKNKQENTKNSEENSSTFVSQPPLDEQNDIFEVENLQNTEKTKTTIKALEEKNENPQKKDASVNLENVENEENLQAQSNNGKDKKIENNVEIIEENSLGNSLAIQEQMPTKEDENLLLNKSKALPAFFSSFLLLFFLVLYLFPMLINQRALFPFEADYNSVLAYMLESKEYFVPAFAENLYAKIFVLPMLFLAGLDIYLPASLQDYNIYFISLAFSFLLFIFSTFCLGLTFKLKKEEFFTALCINYTTILVLVFSQFVQFDFLFAAFINFSLLFFFKAWMKESAFFSMFFAFIFMTLALFTQGMLAFALPLCTGIIFLTLRLDLKRIFKNDALLPFTLFLILLGSFYMYLYYQEDGGYTKALFEMSFLNAPLTSWFNFKKEYIFIPFVLFPFIFLPFFANYKESFLQNIVKKRKKYHLLRAKTIRNIKSSQLTLKELKDLYLATSSKDDDLHLEIVNINNIIAQENSLESEKENSTSVENSHISDFDEKKLRNSIEKKLYTQSVQACSSFFMLIFFIVFAFFFLALPHSELSQLLIVLPLFSLFLAKVFVQSSRRLQRYFFVFLGLCFLLLALVFVTIFMLPQIQNVYPHIISFIPTSYLAVLKQVPHLSVLTLFFTLLALFLFVFSRMQAQKLLFILVFFMLMIHLFIHYFLFESIGLYMYTL